MHEANALTIRIFKYVSAVVALSGIFTFTKFLEGTVEWAERNGTVTNSTIWKPVIYPTELRTTPWYTIYYNWSRLLVLGVIPFVMLVYLNAQIFKDIKARSKRRFNTKAAVTQSQTQNNTTQGGTGYRKAASNPATDKEDASMASTLKNKMWFRKKKKMTTLQITGDKVTVIDGPSSMAADVTEITQLRSPNIENGDMDIDVTQISVQPSSTSDTKENKILQTSKNGGEDIQNTSEIIVVNETTPVLENKPYTEKLESHIEPMPTCNKLNGNFINKSLSCL